MAGAAGHPRLGTGDGFRAADRRATRAEKICPSGPSSCVQGGTGGLAFFSWDVRLSKFFRWGSNHERGVELLFEVFNITNHVNFNAANPGGYINRFTSSAFGTATSVVPNSQRQAEGGLRIRF